MSKRKCWAFFIPVWLEEFPHGTLDKLERLENEGRLKYDQYTCEGPPDQCRDNPDGNYYMLVGPHRDLSPDSVIYRFGVSQHAWDGKPWGNLGTFAEEFPDLCPKKYRD